MVVRNNFRPVRFGKIVDFLIIANYFRSSTFLNQSLNIMTYIFGIFFSLRYPNDLPVEEIVGTATTFYDF